MDLPQKIYNEHEVERARLKERAIGWLQGGAVVVVGVVFLNMIGWLPTLLVVGVLGFVGYKLFSGKRKE